MAYYSSSEASSLANPWRLTAGGGLYAPSKAASSISSGMVVPTSTAIDTPGAQGAHFWSLCSTNLTTDFNAGTAKTVTGGYELGMRPGDVCFGVGMTGNGSSGLLTISVVASVNSTAGTATLSSAAITSTYN